MAVRRDFRSFTDGQKAELINAILELKNNNALGSVYNSYTSLHGDASVIMTPSGSSRSVAHGGSAFLPWHRYLTYRFEIDLQQASGNPNLGIPYWRWWEESDPSRSAMWASNFMGPNGDTNDWSWVVKAGPFRAGAWTIINDSGQPITYTDGRFTGGLKRRLGNDTPSLPTRTNVTFALNQSRYDVANWDSNSTSNSMRNAMEGFTQAPQMHNRLHRWVGQSIRTNLAPNDPFFWIIHSTIDWLWSVWQEQYGTAYNPRGEGPTGHNVNDTMRPFNVPVSSAISYQDLDYSFDSLTL